MSADGRLLCIVEIPKGSRNKYEYDPELGVIALDRFLPSSVVYPADYGFLRDTQGEDGDPLDALVCVSEPTFPGCAIPVDPIALFKMEDEKGPDDTVICVPCDDPGWNDARGLDDLPGQLRAEVEHFFATYKDLEPGKHVTVHGWGSREEAERAIEGARRRAEGQPDRAESAQAG